MFNFFKTTIIGGVIFLIPLVIIAIVLGKAFKVMMLIAVPLDKLIPIDSIGGIAFVNILAVLVILISSFIAGIIAKSKLGKVTFEMIDSKLILFIPGYAYLKGLTGSFVDEKVASEYLKPVLAKLDDQSQLAFEVERTGKGHVVVFLPGAPDPKSGNVVYLTEDRVERLDIDFKAVTGSLKKLGKGSSDVLATTLN